MGLLETSPQYQPAPQHLEHAPCARQALPRPSALGRMGPAAGEGSGPVHAFRPPLPPPEPRQIIASAVICSVPGHLPTGRPAQAAPRGPPPTWLQAPGTNAKVGFSGHRFNFSNSNPVTKHIGTWARFHHDLAGPAGAAGSDGCGGPHQPPPAPTARPPASAQ